MTHALAPEWLFRPETKTLTAAFAKHDVALRFVGGCVRDALLGLPTGDIDAATPLAPEHVMDLLATENIRAIPTGIDHGTVTAVIGNTPFEITTLRRDVATDGRHATVEYTNDWHQDAARRDFTINAFYLSSEGELFDYFSGQEDLKKGHVRFIGEPKERLAEDYLRILRFFRFHARYGKGDPDPLALAACATVASHLASLSGERIQQEMLKILAVKSPSAVLSIMAKTKILSQIMPKAAVDNVVRLEQWETKTGALPHADLRLAALLVSAESEIAAVAKAWKLSRDFSRRLELIVGTAQKIHADLSRPEQKKLLRRAGKEIYQAAVLARASAAQDFLPYRVLFDLPEQWTAPQFPVTGEDLKIVGFDEGKRLGDALRNLEALWEASDYTLTREQVLAKAKTL
jgi:poly(A) polymerase